MFSTGCPKRTDLANIMAYLLGNIYLGEWLIQSVMVQKMSSLDDHNMAQIGVHVNELNPYCKWREYTKLGG